MYLSHSIFFLNYCTFDLLSFKPSLLFILSRYCSLCSISSICFFEYSHHFRYYDFRTGVCFFLALSSFYDVIFLLNMPLFKISVYFDFLPSVVLFPHVFVNVSSIYLKITCYLVLHLFLSLHF